MLKDKNSKKSHFLHLYDRDTQLVKTVTNFIITGLLNGEAVILVATKEHLEAFRSHLNHLGFDTASALERSQLCILDAQETLAKFMVDGMPDKDLFLNHIGSFLDQKIAQFPAVRAYGEMVNVLMKGNNPKATLALEGLWNELSLTRDFSLLCGYHNGAFVSDKGGESLNQVCCSHDHIISADDIENSNEDLQKLLIQQFQYKTMLLQNEVAQRKTTERALRDIENDLLKVTTNAEIQNETLLENLSGALKISLSSILTSVDKLKTTKNDDISLLEIEKSARTLAAISSNLRSLQ
ncbi:MEDS domain-containing protein [Bdellovibrio reynosensis]|uniref:MEDS domain-containing protein n=1 Tax=Bdellovibrio reynosensis TaxID=2835041 RepID=A0ABY4CEC0_9BACT|nr:MEDS domain-containing protein [Bdellovibrio reynosensis]UOF01888.1 MEDS domain-containing protein [Bdellovibrio reynosensis]